MLHIGSDRNRLTFPIAVVAVWTAFALFFGTQNYLRDMYLGRLGSLSDYIAEWLLCGYSWGLLTLPMLWFLRLFSLDRLGWPRFFLVHIPASAVFSSLALAIYVALASLLPGRTGSIWALYEFVFINEFQSEILVYLSVIATATIYWRLYGPEEALNTTTPQDRAVASIGTDHDCNGNPPKYLERLLIKDNGRIALVEIDAIHLVQSYGNYLKIHTASKRHIYRETMTAIEAKLDPRRFIRVRRSAIIRKDQVRELRPVSNGEFEILLKSGSSLTSTRRYRRNLEFLIRP
jgi:hypothetical protein